MIDVKNVYKVFGQNEKLGLRMAQEGACKKDILLESGCTVGLKDISFQIQRSEIFVIMGLSGSGKSTLVRHFNRLIEPSAGAIEVDGEHIMQLGGQRLAQLRRKKISMVFQSFGLLPHWSIVDNVAYGLYVQGLSKSKAREKAIPWLEAVGLEAYANQYPDELSGGMRQRVGLARALAVDTDIILMDEAFSALDPLIRCEMQDLLLTLQEKLQKTIVFITHDIEEAIKLGGRIAILRDGELVQVDAPEQMIASPKNEYVEQFFKKHRAH